MALGAAWLSRYSDVLLVSYVYAHVCAAVYWWRFPRAPKFVPRHCKPLRPPRASCFHHCGCLATQIDVTVQPTRTPSQQG